MDNQGTLSDTIDLIVKEITDSQIVLSATSMWELIDHYSHIMSYNEVLRFNCPIAKLKGKNTEKWCHVVVTRLDSGRYEPLMYAL
jgi:hypothetical protein